MLKEDFLKNLKFKANEVVGHLKRQLSGIRGGRPTPQLIEDITGEYFGQKFTIKQLGSISVLPPRQLQVSVWDKNSASSVLRAIESSNLNVSTRIDDNVIRIDLPPLSGERREELVKLSKREGEEIKINLRHVRDETNREISKLFNDKEIGEDESFKLKESIQEVIDNAVQEVEIILKNKETEIKE